MKTKNLILATMLFAGMTMRVSAQLPGQPMADIGPNLPNHKGDEEVINFEAEKVIMEKLKKYVSLTHEMTGNYDFCSTEKKGPQCAEDFQKSLIELNATLSDYVTLCKQKGEVMGEKPTKDGGRMVYFRHFTDTEAREVLKLNNAALTLLKNYLENATEENEAIWIEKFNDATDLFNKSIKS